MPRDPDGPRPPKEFTADYWLYVLVVGTIGGIIWLIVQAWQRLFP